MKKTSQYEMMVSQFAAYLDCNIRPQVLIAPTIHKNHLKLHRSNCSTNYKIIKRKYRKNPLSSDRQGLSKQDMLLRNHFFNDIFHSVKITLVTDAYTLNNTPPSFINQQLQKAQEKRKRFGGEGLNKPPSVTGRSGRQNIKM